MDNRINSWGHFYFFIFTAEYNSWRTSRIKHIIYTSDSKKRRRYFENRTASSIQLFVWNVRFLRVFSAAWRRKTQKSKLAGYSVSIPVFLENYVRVKCENINTTRPSWRHFQPETTSKVGLSVSRWLPDVINRYEKMIKNCTHRNNSTTDTYVPDSARTL